MKQRLIGPITSIVIMSIVLYVSSCRKTANLPVEINKINLSPAPLQVNYDTVNLDGQIKAVTRVSLSQCPFSPAEIFISKNDQPNWNYESIVKYSYLSTSIVSYFIKNKRDDLKTLVIFYNPAGQKILKMVIAGNRIDKNNIRYQYMSVTGSKHFEITLKDDKEGYNVNIGTSPDFKSLGLYAVQPYGCSRTSGFSACMTCSAKECNETWWCIITCGVASISCVAGWIVACGILNV